MSSAYGPPVCATCDRPIRGVPRRVEVLSFSGARPDVLVHATRLVCLDPSLDKPPARPDTR
ncbi:MULTISPECIES: hypothetical protein [unclassified Streptomyces]|uniref:hypothetical protein n=1 Tax=unclassified Streptomyces TaxID=2593676 RepID=UPI00383050BE